MKGDIVTNPRIVNLTGHSVSVTDGVASARLDSEGRARVHHIDVVREYVNFNGMAIPIIDVREQNIYGLPDEEEGVLYVVSGIVQVAANNNGRMDVVAPGRFLRTGKTVRGAKAFVRVAKGIEYGNENLL